MEQPEIAGMCSRYRLDVSKLTARDTSVNDALTLLFFVPIHGQVHVLHGPTAVVHPTSQANSLCSQTQSTREQRTRRDEVNAESSDIINQSMYGQE